jgi:hypothetical protein
MAMCRPREIETFGKPPRQPLEREQLRTLKHLSATSRYAFLLMDAQASDCLGSNSSRLRANSCETAPVRDPIGMLPYLVARTRKIAA